MVRKCPSDPPIAIDLVPGAVGCLTLRGVPYMADGRRMVFERTANGVGAVFYVFRACTGKWMISVSDTDFLICDAFFTDRPYPLFHHTKSAAVSSASGRPHGAHVDTCILKSAMSKQPSHKSMAFGR